MSTVKDPEVTNGVNDAFEREGYLRPDGDKDLSKVRARILEEVTKRKVSNKKERESKSITRGELVAVIFPSLPGPDDFDNLDENDVDLAKIVYAAINNLVWAATATNAGSHVQEAVGPHMNNGYILCHTKITLDKIDAVYVTDDRECIQLDYLRPDNERVARAINSSRRNRELVIERQPHNAKIYAQDFDRTLKNLQVAAHNDLQLKIEASNNAKAQENEEESESA